MLYKKESSQNVNRVKPYTDSPRCTLLTLDLLPLFSYNTLLLDSLSSYNREVAEPAVTISNLPANYSEAAVLKLFELYKPVRAEVTNGELHSEALVVLGGPADVDLAVAAMGR